MRNMKNISLFSAFILSGFVGQFALAQEIDDMYFNSSDRAKINERKISADLAIAKVTSSKSEANASINPTDSYSARNVNPEYAAQVNTGSAMTIENDFFPADYQPKGINQNLSNCNCGAGTYYNPYYGNSAFSNPYYGYAGGFGSPYSSFYPSSWGYPYGGFRPGLSMSMGYGWGGFSPGFYSGLGYGYSSFWNNYNNPWGYNGWGSNYWNPYYPSQVIVYGGDVGGRRVSYTKRSSRSSNINNNYTGYNRPANSGTVTSSRSSVSSSGRTRTSPEYYERNWRRNQESGTTRGYWNNSNSNSNSNSRSDFNWGNTSSGGRQSSGFSTPSRGSFNSGSMNSGGSRSGSSGSSSGSRSRGRGN